ncbi:MAG: hypothetical protein ACI9FB_003968 [Candidatus Azotimanducaceae bacterium]|jgi:hypothetical protein
MHILTINLSDKLEKQLSTLLKSSFSHTKTMADAARLIKTDEFNFIIKMMDADNLNYDSVTILLGLTAISTKILLIGNSVDSASIVTWQEFGIDFLLDPSACEIAQKIRTNEY